MPNPHAAAQNARRHISKDAQPPKVRLPHEHGAIHVRPRPPLGRTHRPHPQARREGGVQLAHPPPTRTLHDGNITDEAATPRPSRHAHSVLRHPSRQQLKITHRVIATSFIRDARTLPAIRCDLAGVAARQVVAWTGLEFLRSWAAPL
jgi:hypothetical protein